MTDHELLRTDNHGEDCGIPARVVVYPPPSTKSCVEKLEIFTLGVITGAIAFGITAAIVENLDKISSTFGNGTGSESGKSN